MLILKMKNLKKKAYVGSLYAKIIGIVAEFNPFHNGHKYLLDQAGDGIKSLPCPVILCKGVNRLF